MVGICRQAMISMIHVPILIFILNAMINQDNPDNLDSESGDHRVGEKEAGFDSEGARTG